MFEKVNRNVMQLNIFVIVSLTNSP